MMKSGTESAGADLSLDAGFHALLVDSFARLVGRPLVPAGTDAAWLYGQAPFVVVAHNTDPDPRFVYANRAAQACFGYSWQTFVTLPSRLSAEAPERAERERFLRAVAERGFVRGYRGLRVTATGQRFWIEDGVVWQLLDRQGALRGQAATFSSWTPA